MEGEGKDGAIEALNDDITPYVNYNSRIVVDNLEAGEYTIEATTSDIEKGGDFTLTMEVICRGGRGGGTCTRTHSLGERSLH